MNANFHRCCLCAAVSLLAVSAELTPALADPLPHEIIKFQQLPMIATPIPNTAGTVDTYFGHDELSTLRRTTAAQATYQGIAMADDFADEFSTEVLHVRWWGSYLHPPTVAGKV